MLLLPPLMLMLLMPLMLMLLMPLMLMLPDAHRSPKVQ